MYILVDTQRIGLPLPCPELLGKTLGERPGFPEFRIRISPRQEKELDPGQNPTQQNLDPDPVMKNGFIFFLMIIDRN